MYYHPASQNIKNTSPIIFINGTDMDHTFWTLQIRHFSRMKKDVLAIDLPGHGKNKDRPLNSISKISDYIYKFLDTNSISNCSLVGHSMVALIALEMSSSQP